MAQMIPITWIMMGACLWLLFALQKGTDFPCWALYLGPRLLTVESPVTVRLPAYETLPLSQSVFLTLSFHFSPSLPPPLPSSLPLLLPVLSLSLSFFLRLCYDRPKALIPYNSEQNMP